MRTFRQALPWYVHPAEDPAAWRLLAEVRPRPSFVVVNVHDGPGAPGDPWYAGALCGLSGIRLLGYVDLDYGRRTVDQVTDEVHAWLDRYSVGGIMFDQWPTGTASTGRCAEYVTRARRAGAGFVVGNPGVEPPLAHVAMLDVACVFEGTAADHAAFRPSAGLGRLPRGRIWQLVHSCPPEEIAAVTERAARLGAGHVFVTDRTMPHPWGGFARSAAPVPGAVSTPC